jgi:acyl carrier protein
MTREHILSVVLKHLTRSIDGLKGKEIDPKKSMKDLGCNSLDMVEIVSASMRELKVKVPRSDLAAVTNIEGLVELLHQVAEKQGTK